MRKKRNKGQIAVIILIFIVYFIIAARSVPPESILTPNWINSLETEEPIILNSSLSSSGKAVFPFTLGYHFGYISEAGQFRINRIKTNSIYLSDNMWTEYPPEPTDLEIFNVDGEPIINIENPRGYPFLLDNRIFILGSEQNSLSEADSNGNILWTYEFGSLLTDVDAAAGLVVAVSIDGVVEILNSQGNRIYYFQPGGSRLEAIYGCAISRDGTRIGIISGYDPQRFLLLEKYGQDDGEYKVIYHDYLERGYRRPVRISFIDADRRIVYERMGGINCYNIRSRKSVFIPLEGELAAIGSSGDRGMLFLITKHDHNPMHKELIGVRLPRDRGFASLKSSVFLRAPFKSEDVYLGRRITQSGSMLIIGGGATLISFNLEEK